MARLNFFERMEREIDFQQEYVKIEEIVCLEDHPISRNSINDEIEEHFRDIPWRQNYLSFDELREQEHFPISYSGKYGTAFSARSDVGLDDYLTYVEMIDNVCVCLYQYFSEANKQRFLEIQDTIRFDLGKCGFYLNEQKDGMYCCIEKNPAAIAVADVVEPDLGNAVIQYNAHLLKGDIEKKKGILKSIADALEPRRKELAQVNKQVCDDFFYAVNNFDIRHNNTTVLDKNYSASFATLSGEEKEKLYDDTYQLGLLCFLMLENVERHERIKGMRL